MVNFKKLSSFGKLWARIIKLQWAGRSEEALYYKYWNKEWPYKNTKFGIMVSKSIIMLFTECFHEHKIHIGKFKSHNNFKKKP